MLCYEKQYFLIQDMTQESGALSVPLGNRLTNDSNTHTYQEQYTLYIAQSLCWHCEVIKLMIQSCSCCCRHHHHQMNITGRMHTKIMDAILKGCRCHEQHIRYLLYISVVFHKVKLKSSDLTAFIACHYTEITARIEVMIHMVNTQIQTG
jgi:hypothetical protein